MTPDDDLEHFRDAIGSIGARRLILFAGKGGVGKTTISALAALHLASTREVMLFSSDPASNLADIFGDLPRGRLTLESVDAAALYARFLEQNLASITEVVDRGTYLAKEEIVEFFRLAVPGIDELMSWMRIGELVEERADRIVIADTAPAGHTLRMLAAGEHMRAFAGALDAMAEKHRAMIRQFTRRNVRDAIDEFIERFEARGTRYRELFRNPGATAFVPVTLAEPLVVEQTLALEHAAREAGLDVPFVVLNRRSTACACDSCTRARCNETATRDAIRSSRVIDVPRACVPIDSAASLSAFLDGTRVSSLIEAAELPVATRLPVLDARLIFFAGKGGVGKTTSAASCAMGWARENPGQKLVVLSVDPAHSLLDFVRGAELPANVSVESVDTRTLWREFKEGAGSAIRDGVDALTPGGFAVSYDVEALERLLDTAPPGADELFAIQRLAKLAADEAIHRVIVDTAPTGHFLRLLALPEEAGAWVREFMRLLLRYREVLPAGSLGEELLHAARALREFDDTLHSNATAIVVVLRPERIVVEETLRLIAELRARRIAIGAVVANYVTPPGRCECDRAMRSVEAVQLARLPGELPKVVIDRMPSPPDAAHPLALI